MLIIGQLEIKINRSHFGHFLKHVRRKLPLTHGIWEYFKYLFRLLNCHFQGTFLSLLDHSTKTCIDYCTTIIDHCILETTHILCLYYAKHIYNDSKSRIYFSFFMLPSTSFLEVEVTVMSVLSLEFDVSLESLKLYSIVYWERIWKIFAFLALILRWFSSNRKHFASLTKQTNL